MKSFAEYRALEEAMGIDPISHRTYVVGGVPRSGRSVERHKFVITATVKGRGGKEEKIEQESHARGTKDEAEAKLRDHFTNRLGYKISSMKHVGVVKEEVELDEDFTKMDTPTLKKWITTRQRNAMGGNLSKQRGDQYDQAQAEMKKRKANEEVDQLEEMTQGKEYTQAQLQKKIQSGNWEATHDIKPGNHVEMRHHSGKRVTVQVKEESELGDLAHQKTMKHRFLVTYSEPNHTSASMRKEKQQKHVLVPGSKNGVSVHEGEAKPLVKKYMNKQGYRVHDIEHVGMVSKKVNEHVDQLDEADRPSMSVGGVRRREDDEGYGKQKVTGKTSTSHFVHINGRHWKTFDTAADANRAKDAVKKKYPDKRVHVQTKTFYEEAEQVESTTLKSFAAFAGEAN